MTLFEKIKAKSVDEMAEFLARAVFDGVNLMLDDKGLPIMKKQELCLITSSYKIHLEREVEEVG